MTEKYINIENLSVSEILYTFINDEALPNTEIDKSDFWSGFDKTVHELVVTNKKLTLVLHKSD